MKISCPSLWKDMAIAHADDAAVLEIKNRIATFSKDDWKNMAAEAIIVTERLAELVKYNVPADSSLAFSVFMEFKEHFDKWFYEMNKEGFSIFAMLVRFDKNSNNYFNQFEPGLGNYMFHLITINSSKI